MRWKHLSLASIALSAQWTVSPVASDQVVLDIPQFEIPSNSSSPSHITNFQRTIDVAGMITREKTILHLKRNGKDIKTWYFPLEPHRAANLSGMEIYEGQPKKTDRDRRGLKIEAKGFDADKYVTLYASFLEAHSISRSKPHDLTRPFFVFRGVHVIGVEWPHPEKDEAVVSIESCFLGLTTAKPNRLRQNEGSKQGLYWTGDLLAGFGGLPGVFAADSEVKIKVKIPTPRVFQVHSPPGFNVQQATGSNFVIFTNKGSASKLSDEAQTAHLHYFQPFPLIVISNLTRLVEVSHWGNNVAIEDQIHLENRGPKLQGSFSRATYQDALFARTPGSVAHILTGLTLELPQGASSPYYVDTIGNVSTSRFRPSMPSNSATLKQKDSKLRKIKETKSSKLELSPRYPIAGGWNYSFTVGYNLEAGRLLKKFAPNLYILKVPFFTNALDVPIDVATLRVRLPEGAFNVEVALPFSATELQEDLIDKTYLDTLGRPTISIKKLRCTEKHAADIFITYTRHPVLSLQKPFAIAGWVMAVFLLAAGFRRFEWKIGHH